MLQHKANYALDPLNNDPIVYSMNVADDDDNECLAENTFELENIF